MVGTQQIGNTSGDIQPGHGHIAHTPTWEEALHTVGPQKMGVEWVPRQQWSGAVYTQKTGL